MTSFVLGGAVSNSPTLAGSFQYVSSNIREFRGSPDSDLDGDNYPCVSLTINLKSKTFRCLQVKLSANMLINDYASFVLGNVSVKNYLFDWKISLVDSGSTVAEHYIPGSDSVKIDVNGNIVTATVNDRVISENISKMLMLHILTKHCKKQVDSVLAFK